MRKVTLVLAYYENPSMLERQYAVLRALPEELRAWISLTVVDDGSPDSPARAPMESLGIASFELYRVDVDVRWNQDACRNIGAHHARADGWLLLTDMDHLVPEATWRRVIQGRLDRSIVYRFSRVSEPELQPYKPHPNTWLLTRRLYVTVGGYDERFAGWYGTDADFRDRITPRAKAVEILPEVIIRVPREVTPDASTTRYERKSAEDVENIRRILHARTPGARPKTLSFPYHRVV